MTLDGRRAVVVGASAGIGRALAEHARTLGAQVVVVARRAEKLAELDGCHAIAADIADADACRRVVDEAVAHLGGIDLLAFPVGIGALSFIAEADPGVWASIYAVNVIGPTLITGAALPHLSPDAIVSFMSSESTAEPHFGMSAYSVTKAALDTTVKYWRLEHPERRFQRVVMGATIGTDFANTWDPELLGVVMDKWAKSGLPSNVMEADNVGRQLAETYAVLLDHPTVDIPDLTYDPRGIAWE